MRDADDCTNMDGMRLVVVAVWVIVQTRVTVLVMVAVWMIVQTRVTVHKTCHK